MSKECHCEWKIQCDVAEYNLIDKAIIENKCHSLKELLIKLLTSREESLEIDSLKQQNKELYETLYSARVTIEYAEDEHTKIQMLQKIDTLLTKYRGEND